MKVWVKALLLCVLSTPLTAKELVITGALTQGSLLRGSVPAGATVRFNQKDLAVTAEGHFTFGIGRDAPLQHQLEIRYNNKTHQFPLSFTAREYDIQRITGVAQQYVEPPAAVTARIARDNKAVRQVREKFTPVPLFLTEPVKPTQGRISGVYGSQRIFNGQPRNPHFGIDIAAPVGTPVLAPWAGRVVLAEDLYFSGLTLIIDHGMGVSSTLMHLHRFHVKVGDQVSAGQLVADVGATGRVTGPHLDWRINWFQERLDPQLLLPGFAPASSLRFPLN